jgi:hypothetical protein
MEVLFPDLGFLLRMLIGTVVLTTVIGWLFIWIRKGADVQTKMLWTFILFIAPLIGILLYFIMGPKKLNANQTK